MMERHGSLSSLDNKKNKGAFKSMFRKLSGKDDEKKKKSSSGKLSYSSTSQQSPRTNGHQENIPPFEHDYASAKQSSMSHRANGYVAQSKQPAPLPSPSPRGRTSLPPPSPAGPRGRNPYRYGSERSLQTADSVTTMGSEMTIDSTGSSMTSMDTSMDFMGSTSSLPLGQGLPVIDTALRGPKKRVSMSLGNLHITIGLDKKKKKKRSRHDSTSSVESTQSYQKDSRASSSNSMYDTKSLSPKFPAKARASSSSSSMYGTTESSMRSPSSKRGSSVTSISSEVEKKEKKSSVARSLKKSLSRSIRSISKSSSSLSKEGEPHRSAEEILKNPKKKTRSSSTDRGDGGLTPTVLLSSPQSFRNTIHFSTLERKSLECGGEVYMKVGPIGSSTSVSRKSPNLSADVDDVFDFPSSTSSITENGSVAESDGVAEEILSVSDIVDVFVQNESFLEELLTGKPSKKKSPPPKSQGSVRGSKPPPIRSPGAGAFHFSTLERKREEAGGGELYISVEPIGRSLPDGTDKVHVYDEEPRSKSAVGMGHKKTLVGEEAILMEVAEHVYEESALYLDELERQRKTSKSKIPRPISQSDPVDDAKQTTPSKIPISVRSHSPSPNRKTPPSPGLNRKAPSPSPKKKGPPINVNAIPPPSKISPAASPSSPQESCHFSALDKKKGGSQGELHMYVGPVGSPTLVALENEVHPLASVQNKVEKNEVIGEVITLLEKDLSIPDLPVEKTRPKRPVLVEEEEIALNTASTDVYEDNTDYYDSVLQSDDGITPSPSPPPPSLPSGDARYDSMLDDISKIMKEMEEEKLLLALLSNVQSEASVEFSHTPYESGVELSLHPGDVVKNIVHQEDGWSEGESKGKRGLFPTSCLAMAEDKPKDGFEKETAVGNAENKVSALERDLEILESKAGIRNNRSKKVIEEELASEAVMEEAFEEPVMEDFLQSEVVHEKYIEPTIQKMTELDPMLSKYSNYIPEGMFGASPEPERTSTKAQKEQEDIEKAKKEKEAMEELEKAKKELEAEEAKKEKEAVEKAKKEQEVKARKEKEAAEKARKEKEAAERAKKEQEAEVAAENARKDEEAKEAAAKAKKELEALEAAEKARKENEAAKEAAKKAKKEKEAAEKAKKELEALEAAEKARKEKEAEVAAENARKEKEAKEAVEKAKKEQEAKEAAEEAKKEQEAREAATKAKREKEAKEAEEEAKKKQEAKARKEKEAAENARREREAKEAAENDRKLKEAKEAAEKEEKEQEALKAAVKAEMEKEAEEKARREQEASEAAEIARKEKEAKEAAEKAKKEKESRDAAAKAKREKDAKEAKKAAAKAKREKEAADKAKKEKEAKKAAAAKAKKEKEEREAEERAQREREEQEAAEEARREQEILEAAEKAREIVEKAKKDQEARKAAAKARKEQEAKEAAEKALREQEAAEKARKEKEAAERAKKEREAKEVAEKAKKEKEAKEAAEKAKKKREAEEKAKKEKEAEEKAKRERAAKQAAEKAMKEREAKEASDKAKKERDAKEAEERAKEAKEAAQKAKNERESEEATEKALREKAANEAAEKAKNEQEEREREAARKAQILKEAAELLDNESNLTINKPDADMYEDNEEYYDVDYEPLSPLASPSIEETLMGGTKGKFVYGDPSQTFADDLEKFADDLEKKTRRLPVQAEIYIETDSEEDFSGLLSDIEEEDEEVVEELAEKRSEEATEDTTEDAEETFTTEVQQVVEESSHKPCAADHEAHFDHPDIGYQIPDTESYAEDTVSNNVDGPRSRSSTQTSDISLEMILPAEEIITESDMRLQMNSNPGYSKNCTSSALGKAIVAFFADDGLETSTIVGILDQVFRGMRGTIPEDFDGRSIRVTKKELPGTMVLNVELCRLDFMQSPAAHNFRFLAVYFDDEDFTSIYVHNKVPDYYLCVQPWDEDSTTRIPDSQVYFMYRVSVDWIPDPEMEEPEVQDLTYGDISKITWKLDQNYATNWYTFGMELVEQYGPQISMKKSEIEDLYLFYRGGGSSPANNFLEAMKSLKPKFKLFDFRLLAIKLKRMDIYMQTEDWPELKLKSLSNKHRDTLATLLDKKSIASRDWKDFADALGFKNDEIKHMHDFIKSAKKTSPSAELISRLQAKAPTFKLCLLRQVFADITRNDIVEVFNNVIERHKERQLREHLGIGLFYGRRISSRIISR